jgi:hypothetical protein
LAQSFLIPLKRAAEMGLVLLPRFGAEVGGCTRTNRDPLARGREQGALDRGEAATGDRIELQELDVDPLADLEDLRRVADPGVVDLGQRDHHAGAGSSSTRT